MASAEAAERDADRALVQARAAVKEAREHVRRLEKEAAEEYATLNTIVSRCTFEPSFVSLTTILS